MLLQAKEHIEYFFRKSRHYFGAFTWLVLITLFTYTPLVESALKANDALFVNEYCNNQQCGIALLVNLGLLVMVIFDYIGAKKKPTTGLLVLVLLAVFLLFCVFLHASAYVADHLQQYIYPISETYLSIFLHLCFFAILLYFKVLSMEEVENTDIITQEEYL